MPSIIDLKTQQFSSLLKFLLIIFLTILMKIILKFILGILKLQRTIVPYAILGTSMGAVVLVHYYFFKIRNFYKKK